MGFFDFMKPGVFLISPSPGSPDEPSGDEAWYGNIEYLLNISAIGAFCCVALFLFVKLRSDHTLPSVTGLFAKLVAVWHATSQQIACHCGANAAQFLYTEGGSFSMLFVISLFALGVILPVNLYAGTVVMDDQFSKTTINHIPKGSPLLWVHVLFMILVVWVVHYGITILEERLVSTRFHDGPPTANSVTMFTIMVQGVPRDLAKEKHVLEEYFRNKYPGKVYKVVVPQNLCMLNDLVAKLVKIRNELSWLHAHLDPDSAMEERDYTTRYYGVNDSSFLPSNSHSSGRLAWFVEHCKELFRYLKELWMWAREQFGFTEHQRLVRLQQTERELERELLLFKEGRAQGAGIAFVICKDIYTTNKAIQDLGPDQQRPIGRFFPLMELQLGASRWKVERAPPASDIYWNHVGSRKISLKIRRVAVNTALVLLLLFCSSPLAAITALRSAGRIINAEAMDKAQSWLVWVQSTNWAASLILQFLPNVLIFVTMYIIVPSALSSLSKFERHLTVSGEQRAALVKMVCFFLVNLILLRALVESSLENLLLRMGHCYLDGEDCKQIENYMSASFLSRSCLSSLAFLITCTFLGISFDLLAPIPWIKRNLRKLKKNDMLQLVPEQTEEHFVESPEDGLERPLMFGSENGASDFPQRQAIHGIDLQGHDLSIYPESTSPQTPKQNFDFAQYYAFNLTVFALTLIYSAFAPLVLPVGAFYFAYRYVVDKYNFLFVYRIRGFPAGNDGKLVDSVLRIMRLCVVLFVLSMLLYLSVQGDSARLQAVFTCGILLVFKLVPSKSDVVQPFVPGIQTVESVIDGPTDYEVFSQPNCDWEAYHV